MGINSLCLIIMWCILVVLVMKTMVVVWLRPKRIEKELMKQGIKGPKYEIWLGNLKEIATLHSIAMAHDHQTMPLSHDIVPKVLSFYHHWKKIYGPTYVIWFGTTPRVTISDPTMIKEIFFTKSEFFDKTEAPPIITKIEGHGLLNLKGQKWAHRRRLIQPFFHAENLKLMIPMIAKSMGDAVTKLSEKISKIGHVEIDALDWFQDLVEDVITRATFGSSHEDGRAIFQLQAQLMLHAAEAYHKVIIPGYRFLPTKKSRIAWRLEKESRRLLLTLIGRRRRRIREHLMSSPVAADEHHQIDLLELMIKAIEESSANPNRSLAIMEDDVVEECKTIFFAGKHTTVNLLTWTIVLLAMHPRWQEAAREEVLKVCESRDAPITKDDLAKLKTVGMIINETLRLYPATIATMRRAEENVQLGGLHIPRGTELLIPIIAVHHDPTLWSNDAHEFNPARFSEGVAHAAKHPLAFMPFGFGARHCIGQNLAVLQAKLVVAMILRRFTFELAPSYQHAPSVVMILSPKHGAPMVIRNV